VTFGDGLVMLRDLKRPRAGYWLKGGVVYCVVNDAHRLVVLLGRYSTDSNAAYGYMTGITMKIPARVLHGRNNDARRSGG
jgi:hypothetical protein